MCDRTKCLALVERFHGSVHTDGSIQSSAAILVPEGAANKRSEIIGPLLTASRPCMP